MCYVEKRGNQEKRMKWEEEKETNVANENKRREEKKEKKTHFTTHSSFD